MSSPAAQLQKHITTKEGRTVDVYFTTDGGQVSLRRTVYSDSKRWADYDHSEQQQLINEIEEAL